MVAFAATIVRGQCNLLLPNRQSAQIRETLENYPDTYLLTDEEHDRFEAEQFVMQPVLTRADNSAEPLVIPANQDVATVFTSGSTGHARPISKSWHNLVSGAGINKRLLEAELPAGATLFATVPPWHMYGLEWSVMLPLVSDVAIYSEDIFYPRDIRDALERVNVPLVLISTPFHLRAMLRSGLNFPEIILTLCATSPLSVELAAEIQEALGTEILEIYGCSEIGSMASRYPVRNERWRFFPEVQVERHAGGAVTIGATHVPDRIDSADSLEFHDDGGFSLEGRNTDLVKVGGKRASLGDLNDRLLSIMGVKDGTFFDPASIGVEGSGRLAALVVTNDLDTSGVRKALGELIDPVFMPRPLKIIARLPRSETGKLTREKLREVFDANSETG